jgi:hypothetical protein
MPRLVGLFALPPGGEFTPREEKSPGLFSEDSLEIFGITPKKQESHRRLS